MTQTHRAELPTASEAAMASAAPETASEPGRSFAGSAGAARWWLPVLLLLVYAVNCVWFVRSQSLVWDEPIHLQAGLDAWRNQRFELSLDHPPLARLWAALPLLPNAAVDGVAEASGDYHVRDLKPDAYTIALRARLMIVLLGLLQGMLLWETARRIFSPAAAAFALALFAFTPALIAHFSLVTTDAIACLAIFAVAVQLARWQLQPSRARTVLLGVTLGLLLLAKMSAPPFFCLALLLMLVADARGRFLPLRRWNWRPVLVCGAIAFVMVWAAYFFHVSRLSIDSGKMTITFPHREPVTSPVNFEGHLALFVPAGEYFYGGYLTFLHNSSGHRSYLLGKVSRLPAPLFYPLVFAVKWPPMILCLAVAGLWVMRRRRAWPEGSLALMGFPLLMLVLAAASNFGIGERHVLPLYPFALLAAAAVWHHTVVARKTPGAPRLAAGLLLALVALNAADVLRVAPDYLSYFNPGVPPRAAYKLFTDSNLDWGQGLIALRRYEQAHPAEPLHLAYFGSVNPRLYGVRARPLGPSERASGAVVVSATNLSGQYLLDPNAYRWVTQYPLRTVVNHSLYVFDVPAK